MILKNINKLILFLLIFNYSCSSLDSFRNKNDSTNIIIEDIYDKDNYISDYKNILFSEYSDFYNLQNNFIIADKNKFIKLSQFKNNKKNIYEIKPLKVHFYNNKIYNLTFESLFEIYDINTGKKIEEYKIDFISTNKFSYPTSISRINNLFFIGYSDSYVICINEFGEIIWEKSFNDILKTPIKVHDKNLILLLSNNIISINPLNGDINWEFEYANDNIITSYGGSIISDKNILYFILPNGYFGGIDSIIGEPIDSEFSSFNLKSRIINYNFKIHYFHNILSIFENNKYLHSLDVDKNKFIINKFNIHNSKSSFFYNNSLFVIDNNLNLKSYNILNQKIFWKIDLKEYIKKNDKLVKVASTNNNLLVFLSNGKILKLNKSNGEINNSFNMDVKNIDHIDFHNKFLITSSIKNKIKILKQ